ncbi:MAG TPA: MBL fold metallo-hydrolase [Xanthomonadaceae bacterium]|nr:MBL fold metallo-hydrolase [Xanthomonadaceae bacterium]
MSRHGLALRFLGVGSAHAVALGSSSAVLERDGAPQLMIDCGQEALTACLDRYGAPPSALFFTHTHLDHIAGMERLFVACWFDEALRGRTRIFAAAPLVPLLHARVGDYPEVLAEGGTNFWDAFRLVPVGASFWHAGLKFEVFGTRHHAPETSFGLALPGSFAFTGDTRPIPEVLARYDTGATVIAHDCGLQGNPSHTGLDDLEREYPASLRSRMILYHYGSRADGEALRARGLRVADPGEAFALPDPEPHR